MTHERRPSDPLALAARLRLWVLEFVLWLAECLGDSAMTRSMHRWAMQELADAEHFAKAIVVLMAMRFLPSPPPEPQRRCRRPANAPPGFAYAALRGDDMRRVTRGLFPRLRKVLARARRLSDFLDALPMHARRLARRIARIAPLGRLVLLAPPATVCAARVDTHAIAAADTS